MVLDARKVNKTLQYKIWSLNWIYQGWGLDMTKSPFFLPPLSLSPHVMRETGCNCLFFHLSILWHFYCKAYTRIFRARESRTKILFRGVLFGLFIHIATRHSTPTITAIETPSLLIFSPYFAPYREGFDLATLKSDNWVPPTSIESIGHFL